MLLAKIDVCLKELLVALNICIEGIVIVIVKAYVVYIWYSWTTY